VFINRYLSNAETIYFLIMRLMRSRKPPPSEDFSAPQSMASQRVIDLRGIGAIVAERRRALGLSQTALGLKAGLSRMPVYRLEAGRDVALSSLLAILAVLETGLTLGPLQHGPLRATNLARAFAHLHVDVDQDDTS
jgi:hypothetical protein